MSRSDGGRVLLEAKGLRKEYRDGARVVTVLAGVDFAVRGGEIVAVQGPSGSGKSTLLHLLGALDRPTGGTVAWKGRQIGILSRREAARLRAGAFGFVFQFFHLLPELTAFENVLLPARIGRRPGYSPVEGARELLQKAGLAHRAGHRPSQLSGGERQRVALARALLGTPEVVFCDEPTGNLDAEGRDAITRLIREFRDETGAAFVVATHDDRLAASADRTVKLVDGRIQAMSHGP